MHTCAVQGICFHQEHKARGCGAAGKTVWQVLATWVVSPQFSSLFQLCQQLHKRLSFRHAQTDAKGKEGGHVHESRLPACMSACLLAPTWSLPGQANINSQTTHTNTPSIRFLHFYFRVNKVNAAPEALRANMHAEARVENSENM